MTTGQRERPSPEQPSPSLPGLAALFHSIPPEIGRRIADEALRHRPDAPQGVRDSLNAAIDNSSITIDGFKNPSIAPVSKLIDQLLVEITGRHNHKLAGALLEAWKEARPQLASAVSACLEREGVPVQTGKRDRFTELQPAAAFHNLADRIRDELRDHNDPGDARAMLAYLSGRLPHTPSANSDLFADWLNQLDNLPPEAAEWDETDAFAARLHEIAAAKREERSNAQRKTLSDTLHNITATFADDLRYLELEPPAPPPSIPPSALDNALSILEELRNALNSFQQIRPQATTLSEDRQRAQDRDRLRSEAARLIRSWQETTSTPLPDPNIPAPEDSSAPSQNHDSTEQRQLASENNALRAERDRLAAGKKTAEDERGQLERDLDDRQASYNKLSAEKDAQSEENSLLKSKLRELREKHDLLLQNSLLPRITGENPDIEIKNVPDAIHHARQMYEPDKLLIAFNAASDEDTPYQRPREVFDALMWLATDYYDLRVNPPGAEPEYDRRLKEACNGWSFSAKQSDTAKNMFPAEYKTTVNGKTYTLDPHIGEGSKGDPQIMIRIGFAWDDDIHKVIVGYIGLHQRTKAS